MSRRALWVEDFSGHFSHKNEQQKAGDKIQEKSGGSNMKIHECLFCQKPTLMWATPKPTQNKPSHPHVPPVLGLFLVRGIPGLGLPQMGV